MCIRDSYYYTIYYGYVACVYAVSVYGVYVVSGVDVDVFVGILVFSFN